MAHRPLIFTKGPLRLTNLVNLWFESNFDCKIFQFRLLPVELSLMAAQFSSAISGRNSKNLLHPLFKRSFFFLGYLSDADDELLGKPFEFVYGFPDTVKDLTQLTLTIPADTMKMLAKR